MYQTNLRWRAAHVDLLFLRFVNSVLNRNDVFDTALSVDKNKSVELQQDASKATGDEGTHQTAELSVQARCSWESGDCIVVLFPSRSNQSFRWRSRSMSS